MTTVAKSAENVTHHSTASSNNAASIASASRGISNGSHVRPTRTPKFFSWELAIKINSKQPDVLASVLIYGLYTWKPKSLGRFSYTPMINGEYACYRSTRELEKDYTLPSGRLATDSAMLKALKRASKDLSPGFILKEDVATAERGKLHYLVSDKLAKTYKFNLTENNGLTKFYLEDAIKYGSILAGVLLANMDYQITEFKGALTDEDGNKFGELSPAKLTGKNKNGQVIIPRCREAVGDAIRELKAVGAIIEHPTRTGFYRRGTDEVEVSSDEVEVSRREVEVSRRFAETHCNAMTASHLQQFSKTSDSNTYSNPDRKCLEKSRLVSLAALNEASLLGNHGRNEMSYQVIEHKGITYEELMDEDTLHNGVTEAEIMDELLKNDELVHEQTTHELISDEEYIRDFITHKEISDAFMTPDMDGVARHVGCNMGYAGRILLDVIKNAPLNPAYAYYPLTPDSPHAVYKVIDYDKVEFIGYETHYDFIPLDWNTGKPYSRAAEIIYTMEDLKRDIMSYGWPKPKASELKELRQLFITNPALTYDHISELMSWCEPKVEPLYIGDWTAPAKGHDEYYWARRIRNLKTFLKYLPEIIKEWWRGTNEEGWNDGWHWLGQGSESGELVEYKYHGLQEPLVSIAFAEEPLLLKHYQTYLHRQAVGA